MSLFTFTRNRATAALVATALAATATFGTATAAFADSAPLDPTTEPTTVTADALPTVQIDGVVWSQAVVGSTVYAAGSFATARPAGSAAGSNTTARKNALAYDITTGAMTGFNPGFNAQAMVVAVSPDRSRVYIGGDFTNSAGGVRYRIAAFNAATGSPIGSFAPNVNGRIRAIAATNDTVYFGGSFTAVNGQDRIRLAAVKASDGSLLDWTANAESMPVESMVMTPDNSKVIVGGKFMTINGEDANSLAALDATTAAKLPWAVGNLVKNGGKDGSITNLTTDGTYIYGSGYSTSRATNLEGIFKADPSTGAIQWIEDCHGDTYGVYAASDVVYAASHSHYCGNVPGGFPQSDPWTFSRGTAFTQTVEGTLKNDPMGYFNFGGTPAPALLDWFPDINTGTYSGQNQGAWNVTGNSDYVVMGGEFTKVSGVQQQGLVRFAKPSKAPNKIPPVVSATMKPTAVSLTSGSVRLGWQSTYDRDNRNLTYKVIRDNKTAAPVYEVTVPSTFWDRPDVGFVDSGLVPGSTHSYKVFVYDPFGNLQGSASTTVTVKSSGSLSTYQQTVLDDGAQHYYPLNDASGATSAYDWAGFSDLPSGTGVTFGQSGAIDGDDTSASFSGDDKGLLATKSAVQAPNDFTVEAWFNTTSTSGGKIVGFGSSNTGLSGSYDRHVYMDGNGRILFGVYPGSSQVIQTGTGLNDGQWHQVVASLSPAGMQLYVDGLRVGQRTDVTVGQDYQGYWRIGGDNSWSGDQYFDGNIDDVAIYDGALTRAQIRSHYTASGRTISGPAAPTDTYGATIYAAQPDVYWRLDDSAAGTTVVDYSGNGNNGTYANGVTKPVAGALTANPDTAASFDGVDDTVYSNRQFTNPTKYSLELWFNSTSTAGGKLIGFGGSQTGNSSSHDRDVFLQSDGRIAFGAWTGSQNLVTSQSAYNDGAWHQVTATQSSAGMKLYVDGVLVGQNGNTGAENSSNYWRVGGDTVWQGVRSNYVQATIDEVAIYGYPLADADVRSLFDAALPANVLPTASFTSTTRDRTALFDGGASADTDGTIVSYDWTYGDGATGTGATSTHMYDAAGDYSVKLTVTDNRGGTASITHLVTVSAPAAPGDRYGAAVSADKPQLYWRLNESSATTFAADASGSGNTGIYQGNVTKPVTGALATGDGSAARFAGSDNGIASTNAVANPTTYSLELWFKTGTTRGGKLIGFGNSQNGLSSSYDRHIYLQDNGQLVFGTYDGATHTITSANSYNDNAWHQVVAMQSSAGQKLYVDGRLEASDGVTTQQNYTGYWKVGGDTTWGSSSPWYSGDIDEVAVYDHPLTSADVLRHYQLGSTPVPANEAPTADFSATVTGFGVSVNGSASSDPDGSIASYAWTFGDGGTASGKTAGHSYLAAGDYDVTLTVTDDAGATAQTTKTISIAQPNSVPTAAFTSTVNDLAVSVDGSTSSDSDGTVTSYAWTFGDGGTATGPSAQHTYTNAGTYTVALTVTDDDGGTAVISRQVTAVAPNVAPTASFTASAANLAVNVDGRASADSDGTIASYAWTFGDGATATGSTASHSYTTAGTYTVTLTTTDDDGATAQATKQVTVAAAPVAQGDFATDTFERTFTNGLGIADLGGPWNLAGPSASAFSVSAGSGNFRIPTAGSSLKAYLGTVTATSADVVQQFSADKNGVASVYAMGRRVTSTDVYSARVRYLTGNQVALALIAQRGSANDTVLGSEITLPGTFPAGTVFNVRVQVTGTSPTSLKAKLWAQGSPEPSVWQLSATDSTATLQKAGSVGIVAAIPASATGAPVTVAVREFHAAPVGSSTPANQAPVAAFTAAPTGLSVSVDGSTSSDPDGTVASYGWTFGDGATATGVTASHPYAAAGTYDVTLTVTDNTGATTKLTKKVTVSATANAAPTASFTAAVTDLTAAVDGSASTDSDGTVTGYAWNFGDGATATGATASHPYAAGGTYTVTLTVTDNAGATATATGQVTVTAPAAPQGDFATDTFERTFNNGLGVADLGGAWSIAGPAASNFAVNGGAARLNLTAAGTTLKGYLAAASGTSSDVTMQYSADNNAAAAVYVLGRRVTSTDVYSTRVRYGAGDTVAVALVAQRGSANDTVLGTEVTLPGTYPVGTVLNVRLQVSGTSPTTLKTKVWADGAAEPDAWLLTATDNTGSLQKAGAVGMVAALPAGSTAPVSVAVREFHARPVQ